MAIHIKGLSKSYQSKPVLKGVDLVISTASIFGLLGVNGAGKTTLVSILNFLQKKDKGDIHIFNKNIDSEAEKIKPISSYVPQSFAFYPNLTGYENLVFFASLHGLKGQQLQHNVDNAIALVNMQDEVHTRARKYSGGYKRRLNLAIGLLNNPTVLYLDEPTVGVDAHTRGQILNTIKNLNQIQKTTIIYTSHYMEEIEYICDDIAILDKGRIILQEKKETLMQQHTSLQDMFMDLTKEEFIV